MKNNFSILAWFVVLYFVLKYFVPFWNYVIYPVSLIVTFLHEFWHAFFALITWGQVHWIHINTNWSWYTITSGWIQSLILMWGYIGSAIFWNILLYLWFKKPEQSKYIIYFLAGLMFFVAFYWFNNFVTSLILFVIWTILFLVSNDEKLDALILQLLWVFSILYIIQDFAVGPSSDLAKFSTILPKFVWMIIWLLIVLIITWWNLKNIFRK